MYLFSCIIKACALTPHSWHIDTFLLTFLHELGSTGASELRDFDGNVILKASNYNGGGHVNAVNAAVASA